MVLQWKIFFPVDYCDKRDSFNLLWLCDLQRFWSIFVKMSVFTMSWWTFSAMQHEVIKQTSALTNHIYASTNYWWCCWDLKLLLRDSILHTRSVHFWQHAQPVLQINAGYMRTPCWKCDGIIYSNNTCPTTSKDLHHGANCKLLRITCIDNLGLWHTRQGQCQCIGNCLSG